MGFWKNVGGWLAAFPAWHDFWYTDTAVSTVETSAGVTVSPTGALKVSVVNACVRIISSSLAMLPLIVYERVQKPGGKTGRRRAEEHRLYRVLHERPNEYQTPFEWKQEVAAHLATRGNFFNEEVLVGRELQLWPIHPDHVGVDWLDKKSGRRRMYDVASSHDGRARVLSDESVWHGHLLSIDGGLTGASPVRLAAEGIGLAAAQVQSAARFHGSGSQIAGYLKNPGTIKDEKLRRRIKSQWRQAYSGPGNAWRTPLLEGGLEYQPIGIKPVDAQLVDTMRWSVADLARVWGMPLALIGETEKSTSWGTGIEHFMIMLATYTLSPYFVLFEQGATSRLLDGRRYYAEFLVDALLRGDLKTRFEAYATAVNANVPWMTRNEIRARENLDPDSDPASDSFPTPTNNVTVPAEGGNGAQVANLVELLAAGLERELEHRKAETDEGVRVP
jgi:HK97 family phage portal protein